MAFSSFKNVGSHHCFKHRHDHLNPGQTWLTSPQSVTVIDPTSSPLTSHLSGTFLLLFFSPPLHNFIIFFAVIKGQMLNKVCRLITAPHHITFSIAIILRSYQTRHVTAFAVRHHQCPLSQWHHLHLQSHSSHMTMRFGIPVNWVLFRLNPSYSAVSLYCLLVDDET